jgi:hypothetical protein
MKCLRPIKHWGRGLESHKFVRVSVVLRVGSGLATELIQRLLPAVYRIHSSILILMRRERGPNTKYRKNYYRPHRICTNLALILSTVDRRSRYSVVGIKTGYGLDDRGVGVRVSVGSRIFSPQRRPDRPWGPPNLLFNGYREPFPRC